MIRWNFIHTLLAALICFSWSAGAHADWEYTRWGMTKNEVVKASKGQAVPFVVEKREDWGIYPDLVAPVRFAKYSFSAQFYFGAETGALDAVRLDPVSGVWCPDIAKELFVKYGVRDKFENGRYYWWDKAANNKISLAGFSTCRIKIVPLN